MGFFNSKETSRRIRELGEEIYIGNEAEKYAKVKAKNKRFLLLVIFLFLILGMIYIQFKIGGLV